MNCKNNSTKVVKKITGGFTLACLGLLMATPQVKAAEVEDAIEMIKPDFEYNITVDGYKEGQDLSDVTIQNVEGHPDFEFKTVSKDVVTVKDADLKYAPQTMAQTLKIVKKGTNLKLIGQNDLDFWLVKFEDKEYYIQKDLIKEVTVVEKEAQTVKAESKWNGPKLTKSKGINKGPSGKETYYNLPMGGVIKTMRRMGNTDKHWVRPDGAKMLGDYVMVAANLKVRPRGSLVETSLGTGIVCDTGGFAKNNPYQIDIAVNW